MMDFIIYGEQKFFKKSIFAKVNNITATTELSSAV
jgi:hypothetical protein